jgi:hypothetical protein
MTDETSVCELCGHPMPEGEEMFKYHGYSGPCPAPPLAAAPVAPPMGEPRLEAVNYLQVGPPSPWTRWLDASPELLAKVLAAQAGPSKGQAWMWTLLDLAAEYAESRLASLEAENRRLLQENERLLGYPLTVERLERELAAAHGYIGMAAERLGCEAHSSAGENIGERVLCAIEAQRSELARLRQAQPSPEEREALFQFIDYGATRGPHEGCLSREEVVAAASWRSRVRSGDPVGAPPEQTTQEER